ncbi:hypothetical protein NX722_08905 [Endozoicomonas gorgoniicola]|uniref:Dual OB-containing domain-containing protein n=1 Tax=Endozoicomonas gorgoniicola TaxID=1234144 RepID=A0ABT3MTS9_9GAMM|nr:hypothetical protein [Endozoicomonas gorgoniicola]MCW7552758.1 hypothetical protein [Endozoicomonas gorgoniicola]
METKELLVLARSKKHGKYCVAGKTIDSKMWIRAVSTPCGAAVGSHSIFYIDKGDNKKYIIYQGQIIKFNFFRPTPLTHQPENWHFDRIVSPQEAPYVNKNNLVSFIDQPASLWGRDNKISYAQIKSGIYKVPQSLYFIKVQNLSVHSQFGKKRVVFTYNNIHYNLPTTFHDAGKYIDKTLESCFLCVSLGEEYNGYCYKLVASIFFI